MIKKTYRFRLLALIVLSMMTFVIIGVRLYFIQVAQYDSFKTRADHQQHKKVILTPRRGDIVDRNGLPLATSYFTDTIIIDTAKVREPSRELIDDLAAALQKAREPIDDPSGGDVPLEVSRMSHERAVELVEKMFARKRRNIFYRKAPEELSQLMAHIEDRHMLPPGFVIYEKHSKRFYPNHSLASHVVGYTKIDDSGDNIGMAGVEKQYDSYLRGNYSETQVQINSGQRGLSPLSEEAIQATYGNTLQLTIDKEIQMFTERALRAQVGRYMAKGGIAIIMDVHTGEILAMANCPDFNLNDFSKADPLQRRNRILTDPIEIGSVMKIITATLLIDQGLLNPNEIIDCRGGYAVINGRIIKDVHPIGAVPFREAFAESSNIGLVTVGLRLEPSVYYQGLTRFGLGRPVGIDLPGEGTGVLYPLEKWSGLSRTSLPMGYEASMTPVQVISAMGAIANNGWRMRPHLVRQIATNRGEVVKKIEPEPIERVASTEACGTIRELMEAVITEGTGDKAAIPGYRIGGKTGTTVKYNSGQSERRLYYGSFAGLFPIDEPRLAIYCYIDEPQGEKYGGRVAAPLFREIAVAAAHILGIKPTDPAAFEQARLAGGGPFDAMPTSTTLIADGATTESIAEALIAEENGIAPPDAGEADEVAADAGSETPAGATADETDVGETADEPEPDAELATATPTPAPDPNSVELPDVRGMTMLQACDRMAEAGLEVRLLGSGIAQRQEPAPGQYLQRGATVTIIFAHPSKARKSSGESRPIAAR